MTATVKCSNKFQHNERTIIKWINHTYWIDKQSKAMALMINIAVQSFSHNM